MTAVITSQVSACIRKGFRFGELIHCHPFTWDNTTNKPKFVETWAQRGLWALNISVCFLYYIFILVRTAQVNLYDHNAEISQRLYMRFVCVYYLFPVVFQVFLILNVDDFPGFICCYLKVMENLKGDLNLKSSGKLMKMCQVYMEATYHSFRLLTCMVIIYSVIMPQSPELVSSVFMEFLNRPLTFLETIPAVGFVLYMQITYLGNAFAIIFAGFGYLFSTLEVIQHLNSWCTQINFEGETIIKFFRIYSYLRILLTTADKVFSRFIIPAAKVMIIGMAVFCTYGAIRLHGFLSLVLGLLGIITSVFMTLMFNFIAEFHTKTSKMINSLKGLGHTSVNQQKSSWLGHSIESLPVLKFYINEFYFIDKRMVLRMVKFVTETCVTFLLANPA